MPPKESIRGTGAACKECRRLKVRCDREVPCGSCVRRGCAGICPDGQLSSNKSARYVLASTEELHDRIQALTFRIHSLEHGLELEHRKVNILEAQNQPSHDSPVGSIGSTSDFHEGTHPLLEPHLKRIAKDPREPETEDQTGTDTYIATGNVTDSSLGQGQFIDFDNLNALLQLTELSMDHYSEMNAQNANQIASSYLPVKEEALRLVEVYFNNATVIFHPVERNRVINILIMAYDPPSTALGPHDLSILFSVLAIGIHVDVTNAIANSFAQSSKWLSISQALLMAQGESTETTVTMVEAILMLSIGYFMKHGGGLKVLQLVAMAIKHALILCMENDAEPGTWTVEEMLRRNRIFWELWTLDSILGVEFMLPPTLLKAFVGAKPPSEIVPKNTRYFAFAEWKYDLVQVAQELLTILLSSRSGANASVPYSAIMVLDAKIRATRPAALPQEIDEISTMLGDIDISGDGRRMMMMGHLSQTMLLHLHKSYFAVALMKEQPPMSGKLAPSVLACYNCSVEILHGSFDLLRDRPGLLSRLNFVWSNYFAATAVLYAIAIYMPYWVNAAEALKIADAALVGLFTVYAPECLYADRALPALKHLTSLANDSMNLQRSGGWIHPSRTQLQASPNLDILSSTGRLKVPNSFSSSINMAAESSNDVIGDLFGSRAGGVKNTEMFGIASSSFYGGNDTTLGASVGASYSGIGSTLQVPGSADDSSFTAGNANRTLSWDDLIRGIQTSQVPTARNFNASDSSDLPDSVTLRNAWKGLLNALQIK